MTTREDTNQVINSHSLWLTGLTPLVCHFPTLMTFFFAFPPVTSTRSSHPQAAVKFELYGPGNNCRDNRRRLGALKGMLYSASGLERERTA